MDFVTFISNQRDRVAAWVCIGLGVVALILGWVGVSSTPYPAEQIPYVVTGGLGGLFLLGLGAVLWLSADLRDEWRKLDLIEEILRDRADAPAVGMTPIDHAAGRRPRSEQLSAQ